MSEFEKELEKSKSHDRMFPNYYHEKILIKLFKDWQPPKPLVAVPQIVADFIEVRKKELKLHGAFLEIEECYGAELYNWVFQKRNGQDLFARAWLDGYTVEKEKMYILKHIDLSEQDDCVSLYLSHGLYKALEHIRYSKDVNMSEIERCHFIQTEIDKLNIGSYEQIPVEMSDNGI